MSSNKKRRPASQPTKPDNEDDGIRINQRKMQREIKRQRLQDFNTHKFLDASATVQAGLFGARRLPEVKALWRSLVNTEMNLSSNEGSSGSKCVRKAGESGGGKLSSRHLRRRTGSYKPRRRHRFPRGDCAKGRYVGTDGDNPDALIGIDSGGDSMRTNNNAADGDSGSQVKSDMPMPVRAKQTLQSEKNPCRRARRKLTLLRKAHSTWWTPSNATQPYPDTLREQSDRSKPIHWIPAHHWHAKRFQMSSSPLFSWSVPLIHSNRGCRASLRLASSKKCTIQDATWEIDGCAMVLTISRRDDRLGSHTLIDIFKYSLRRICGEDASFLKDDDVLRGSAVGEGLIYDVDSFPLKPVGPATFLFRYFHTDAGVNYNNNCNRGNLEMKVLEKSEGVQVAVMTHPSIQTKVIALLKAVAFTGNSDHDTSLSIMPVSLLRIRGSASSSILTRVIPAETLDLERKHGDILYIEVADTRFDDVHMKNFSEFQVAESCSENNIQSSRGSNSDSVKQSGNAITVDNPRKMLIKKHQPHDQHNNADLLPHNIPCSGWDIFCHPSMSLHLFQMFIMNGSCAIGFAEDARARMEALPPLAIFPRDYPDTTQGKVYWEGDGSISKENSTEKGIDGWAKMDATTGDWAVIRACLEGSWGRMNTTLNKVLRAHKQLHSARKVDPKDSSATLPNQCLEDASTTLVKSVKLLGRDTKIVQWSSLIPPHKGTKHNIHSVIVVRGSFGVPFLQILHGCGKLYSCRTSPTKKHQKRRKHRSKIHASPLSAKEAEAHSSLCQQLLQSLSLPALLRCEIYCDGKGTLNPGDLLYPLGKRYHDDKECTSNDNDGMEDQKMAIASSAVPLGVVVAGGFSPSRGICHGVGFVGASRFIEAVDGADCGMGMKISDSLPRRKMMLKAYVGKPLNIMSTERLVLISLLL